MDTIVSIKNSLGEHYYIGMTRTSVAAPLVVYRVTKILFDAPNDNAFVFLTREFDQPKGVEVDSRNAPRSVVMQITFPSEVVYSGMQTMAVRQSDSDKPARVQVVPLQDDKEDDQASETLTVRGKPVRDSLIAAARRVELEERSREAARNREANEKLTVDGKPVRDWIIDSARRVELKRRAKESSTKALDKKD